MTAPSHFGRYRVLRPLATGEMGIVYLAEDPIIGRKLAIKGIRFDPGSNDEEIQRLQERFQQEIQIAGTFSHPNIVTLYDVGQQNGSSFIAMEYVDGRNLRAELQASGPMPADRVTRLAVPLCRALAYAHERNVVHRDIKPTNILVSSEGVPKITDFGVALLGGSTLTHAGKIFGTPAYMSPEQAIGGDIDGRSDQFALCTVLYELLTGKRPFTGASPTSVIYQVLEHEPPPPHEIVPLLPTAVSEIVMRGLDKNPNRRYGTCAELADALKDALAWSRANPELAYFDDRPAEPEPDAGHPLVGWRDGLSGASAFAARWGTALAASSGWDRARSAMAGAAQRRGRLAVLSGGALALIAAVTAVTWAAVIPGQLPGLGTIGTGNPGDAAIESAAGSLPDRDRGVSRGSRSHDLDSGAAPAAVPIASTNETAELLATLGDRPHVFAIASRPAGATVYLNGQRLSDTSPVSVSLHAGASYTVRLERDGYEASGWRFDLTDLSVEQFRSGQLYFPLAPAATPIEEQVLDVPARAIANPPAIVDATSVDTQREVEPAVSRTGGPPPSPGNIRRVRVPGEAPAPEKLRHVDPEVPSASAAEGFVVVEIEVSSRGNVVQAKVLRGLDAAADRAALDAVVRWKYQPTRLSGVPVHVLMTVTLPMSGSR